MWFVPYRSSRRFHVSGPTIDCEKLQFTGFPALRFSQSALSGIEYIAAILLQFVAGNFLFRRHAEVAQRHQTGSRGRHATFWAKISKIFGKVWNRSGYAELNKTILGRLKQPRLTPQACQFA